MNKPYLVLRLEKSHNSIKFPCPESAAGFYLHPKGVQPEDPTRSTWINTAISAEYMGSAEFELGAIPKALRNLANLGKEGKLVEEQISFEGNPDMSFRAKGKPGADELNKPVLTTTWLLCPKEIREELIPTLKEMTKSNSGPTRMKEAHYMQEGLFGGINQEYNTDKIIYQESRRIGWFDLENLWFLTRDKNQMTALKMLLGLKD